MALTGFSRKSLPNFILLDVSKTSRFCCKHADAVVELGQLFFAPWFFFDGRFHGSSEG